MAIQEQFISPNEMDSIKDAIEILNDFNSRLDALYYIDVNVFQDASGEPCSFPVSDSNGDIIGHLGIGDEGDYVLFLDDGRD